jgi:prepilin-type N-terminal cleavage/methylation domain-containing protein
MMKKNGYSLIEVLIAIAITSVVLLTVVTLFYMGRRNVYSGKQMTYAVSVGTRMLEDFSAMSASDVLSNFNIVDTTAKTTVTVQGVGGQSTGSIDIANSAGRDTSTCTVNPSYPATPPVPQFTCTNDTGWYLSGWRSLLDPSKLTNGQAGIVITPRNVPNPPPSTCENPPCPWTSARYLKVRAWVAWDEAKNRRRIAFFDTTKVNRD